MNPGRILVVICLTSSLAGCGQKGPLVLPDAARPHKTVSDRARDRRPVPAPPADPNSQRQP